jgi:hypothetical protein
VKVYLKFKIGGIIETRDSINRIKISIRSLVVMCMFGAANFIFTAMTLMLGFECGMLDIEVSEVVAYLFLDR